MDKKTGGPAFPHPQGWRRDPEISDGMSLRDYFAANVLSAICGGLLPHKDPFEMINSAWYSGYARHAYLLADAMIKEREK